MNVDEIHSKDQPPPLMIARCAEVNKQRLESTIGIMEVYWADRMWKYRVIDRKKPHIVLIGHIRQESFAHDDHWIYLAISAIQDAYVLGITDGKLNCVERMMQDACNKLGVSQDMYLRFLREKGLI